MGGGVSPLGPPYPRGRALRRRPLRAHVAPASPRSPRFWSLSSRFLPLARWFALLVGFFSLRLHRSPPVSPPRTTVCPLSPPHVPSPPPRCPRPFPGWVGEKGGGGRPRCPSSGVSTSQARRRHEVRHLSLCRGGGGLAVWLPSSPFLPCVRTPGAPPRWGLHGACFLRARSCGPSRTLSPLPPHLAALSSGGGGAPSAPSFLHPPPLGGRRCVGGGGIVVFPSLHACRRHDASTAQARGAAPVPLQGGGGMPVAPVVALSTLRSHPRWSPRWGLHGACPLRARSCGPSRTLSPLPPHPAALSSGWGRFSPPPPLPASPTLGGAGVCGGGGAPMSSSLRCMHVAGTTQARRKHGVRHLAAAGEGGGFSFGPSRPSPWYRLRTPGSPATVAPWR